jgi:TolB protein
MDIDGSNVKRRLTSALSPSWSPDGKRLAVTSSICYCDIFVLNADDNSAPIAVGFMARQPAWSPDGGRIAFVSLSGLYENHALHVMNADGTGVTVVSARDAGYIDHPTWSPDGTQIAFSKCIDVKCDIHVALADGSSIRKLTTTGNVREPAWSPDGSWLAVSVNHNEFPSIAYIDAQNGGDPIQIQSSGWSPEWLPTTSTVTRRD